MKKKKIFLFLLIFIIVVLGIGTKYYRGWQSELINNKFGGVFYVLFWMLVLYSFFPRLSITKNAVIVFLTTSMIEFLQLLNLQLLTILRASFIGRIIFGTTFCLQDFIFYGIGAVLGIFLLNSQKDTQ
jgi:hypothetical protein